MAAMAFVLVPAMTAGHHAVAHAAKVGEVEEVGKVGTSRGHHDCSGHHGVPHEHAPAEPTRSDESGECQTCSLLAVLTQSAGPAPVAALPAEPVLAAGEVEVLVAALLAFDPNELPGSPRAPPVV